MKKKRSKWNLQIRKGQVWDDVMRELRWMYVAEMLVNNYSTKKIAEKLGLTVERTRDIIQSTYKHVNYQKKQSEIKRKGCYECL